MDIHMKAEKLESNSTYAVLKRNGQSAGVSSRVYDTARWTFNSQPKEISSLAFLPIVAMIVLVLCSLMKAYKWSRESARWKAQGDVEFSEETENYDIINIGDREFCQVDMIENGYALQLNEAHPYHDTVTSFKSLLMQKADGSQYDSVKSYKAFLQKVTQNKDLAVEVKLLENYPIHSKSTEHCVVLEEDSSERSGEAIVKILGALPLNKQLHKDGRFRQADKKKTRHRRASGDAPPAMRKRSASNPTYRRVTNPAGSLPSIHYTVSLSSDSDEDTQRSFVVDRKKLWAERKKISRSISGGKISKESSSAVVSNNNGSNGTFIVQKRIRHFSADCARHVKKTAASSNKNVSNFVNNVPDLKNTQKIRPKTTKTMTKPEKTVDDPVDESSSENPASSNSSDSDVLSDAVISNSDDDDTKRNTLMSNASDDITIDNDVFFSVDSGAELVSSSEMLQSSPKRPLAETKILIARAKEEFFMNKPNNTLMSPCIKVAKSPTDCVNNKNSNSLIQSISIPIDNIHSSDHFNHSAYTDIRTNPYLQNASELVNESQFEYISTTSKPFVSTHSQSCTEEIKVDTEHPSQQEESRNLSSPSRVQRFQVTSVNNDVPSLTDERSHLV